MARHVNSGDRLKIPAADWNGLMDVLEDSRFGRTVFGKGRVDGAYNSSVVLVINDTEEDFALGAVVGLGAIISEPPSLPYGGTADYDKLNAFLGRATFHGADVDDGMIESGSWGIAVERIESGKTGLVQVTGVVPALSDSSLSSAGESAAPFSGYDRLCFTDATDIRAARVLWANDSDWVLVDLTQVKLKHAPFWVYNVTDYEAETIVHKVKVTGGLLVRGIAFDDIEIADSDEIEVEDGDKVWLERTDANEWSFNSGAEFPDDCLFYPLCEVAIGDGSGSGGGDGDMTLTHTWNGGNLPHGDSFRVDLTNDGGSYGDWDTDCSFTYSAEVGGMFLTAALAPQMSAARINPWRCIAATKGTVDVNAAGEFELWDCNEKQDVEWLPSRPAPCTKTLCEEVAGCRGGI